MATKETATAEYLRQKGFSVQVSAKEVYVTGRPLAVLGCVENWKTWKPAVTGQESIAERAFDDSRAKWCEGTTKDLENALNGRIDMVPFEKAREKFMQTDLCKKLQERFIECRPRRQRTKSEYDGDFSEERRWDIQPFDGVKKAPGFGRSIDVIVYGSVNCSTDGEELERYGNMVWSLVDLIEANGINCRVINRYISERFIEGRKDCKHTLDIELKKAGEYVAPSLLAACCKAVFFRRAVFQQIVMAADARNEVVSSGLGSAYQHGARIEFSDGQLVLSPSVNSASFQEIEKAVLEAIA